MKISGFHFLICVVIVMLGACVSTEKLLDQGDYDRVIRIAENKLRGKKRKKEKHVMALEEAFRKAHKEDMATIQQLESSTRPEDWEHIRGIARRLETRQEILKPYLPLVADSGYEADFTFVRTGRISEEAAEKVVSLYYQRAEQLLQLAKTGDKRAARKAFADYKTLDKYDHMYPDIYAKQKQAKALGTVFVELDVQYSGTMSLPIRLEAEIRRLDFDRLTRDWITFYSDAVTDIAPDYTAQVDIRKIAVSPNGMKNRKYRRTREIEDGWEYVLDENGNVAKDSLGNDIKETRYIQVEAAVVETMQEKEARIRGRIDLYNHKTRQVERSRPIDVLADFKHVARTATGDLRALEKQEAQMVPPIPFPTEEEMILMALDELKPALIREIESYRLL